MRMFCKEHACSQIIQYGRLSRVYAKQPKDSIIKSFNFFENELRMF